VTRRCDNDITDTNFDHVQAISQCELNVTLTGMCFVHYLQKIRLSELGFVPGMHTDQQS
jgi:hypothetical protein